MRCPEALQFLFGHSSFWQTSVIAQKSYFFHVVRSFRKYQNYLGRFLQSLCNLLHCRSAFNRVLRLKSALCSSTSVRTLCWPRYRPTCASYGYRPMLHTIIHNYSVVFVNVLLHTWLANYDTLSVLTLHRLQICDICLHSTVLKNAVFQIQYGACWS